MFDVQGEGAVSSATLQRPSFDLSSNFLFDEPEDHEDFGNMQRTIESFSVMADEHQHVYHSSIDGMHNNSDMSDANERHNAAFVDPFVFDRDDVSPRSSSWPHQHSPLNLSSHTMQGEIASRRKARVAHQFGQITPPSDDTFKASMEVPWGQAFNDTAGAPVTLSAKSERARHAANKRHAKARKARKEGSQGLGSPTADDEEVEDKRERYREKNRLAAAKCRAKKKVNTEDLEESARVVMAKNNKLRAEERELRDMFSSLRDHALAHDASQGCDCQAIHSYNLHQAHQTARGAMGIHSLIIASPPQVTGESASPVSAGAPTRLQSFSGM